MPVDRGRIAVRLQVPPRASREHHVVAPQVLFEARAGEACAAVGEYPDHLAPGDAARSRIERAQAQQLVPGDLATRQ
jgi:hypothetical protein